MIKVNIEEIEDLIREISDEMLLEIKHDRESSLEGHGLSNDFEWGFKSFRDEFKERLEVYKKESTQ